jgi:hypothetical protein
MAAFSSFHGFVPGAASQRASVASTPRVTQGRVTNFAETARQVIVAAGEIALCLWTVLALAFPLLVMAGFFF